MSGVGMAQRAVETRAERTGRRPRFVWVLVPAVVTAGLIVYGWNLWEIRRYRRDMAEIKSEIRAGRHGHAVRKLEALLAGKEARLGRGRILVGSVPKDAGTGPGSRPSLGAGLVGFVIWRTGNSRADGAAH